MLNLEARQQQQANILMFGKKLKTFWTKMAETLHYYLRVKMDGTKSWKLIGKYFPNYLIKYEILVLNKSI